MKILCIYLEIFLLLLLIDVIKGLKCRNAESTSQSREMEWAVRQCVQEFTYNYTDYRRDSSQNSRPDRQQGNHQNGRHDGQPNSQNGLENSGIFKNLRGWEHSQRNHRDVGSKRERDGSTTERGWPHPLKGDRIPPWEVRRYPNGRQNENRFDNRNEDPPNMEDDTFGVGPPERRRQRVQSRPPTPHTPGQQSQYDRDSLYNSNRRPLFQPSNNNNAENPWEQSSSKLATIDPCTIHCIFQELKMLNEWGRIDKEAIIDQMTRRVRERELREFLQFTIDECFNEMDRDGYRDRIPGRYGHDDTPDICRQTKTLAICLEDRGHQACDDWDDPMNTEEKDNSQQHQYNNKNNRDKNKDDKKVFNAPNRG